MTLDRSKQDTEIQELIQRAKALRQTFARTSAQVDASGEVPEEHFRQIGDAGLYRLSIPQAYGGLWDGNTTSLSEASMEVICQLCAGEGSTGMIFAMSSGMLRLCLGNHSGLPETIQQQVAREVLNEHVRLIASGAETGTGGHVTAHKVDGGMMINGTKSFNTGSQGARYACVTYTLEGEQGTYIGLVRLDDPGVTYHHDWDNMGQRATMSQTITYQNVFIPDNWYYNLTARFPLLQPILGFLGYASITLGIGEGGYDALLEYLQNAKRTITPGWTNGMTDPLVRKRIGEFSTRLAAAHALLREVSRQMEQSEKESDLRPLIAGAMRVHAVCIDAAVSTTSELFELTGARSTSNRYRLDRFWRNARTFSLHDPIEAKLTMIGGYELTGELPVPGSQ
jgi:alkylation response protein AidB-like acyl-CoA dehydrogenase